MVRAVSNPYTRTAIEMCYYERIHFKCGHIKTRLFQHCHFARNDLNHQCFGAWNIKREWENHQLVCDNCANMTGKS